MDYFGTFARTTFELDKATSLIDKLRERIGNPGGISVRDLAEMVTKSSCSGSKPIREPLDKYDPNCGCPDITRARETLGWEPRVPAKEGLKLTFEWFAQRLSPSEATPLAKQ
jgi:nucleoside-diphosphate-sugar epimerase